MNPQDITEFQVGIDAESFMNSSLGRYFQSRANQAIVESLQRLADVDPEDAKAIRALQNDVQRANTVLDWISEAITAGNEAGQRIEASDTVD